MYFILMKASSLSDIKKELQHISSKELLELCINLAKYKKDNKEYLDFLLFESHDKALYITSVKKEIDEHFDELKQQANLYYVKKGLRKQLRLIGKYSKYVSDKSLTAELLIYFCKKLKNSGIPYRKSQLIVNMYEQQIKKINTLINSLHEDLQQDYLNDLGKLID